MPLWGSWQNNDSTEKASTDREKQEESRKINPPPPPLQVNSILVAEMVWWRMVVENNKGLCDRQINYRWRKIWFWAICVVPLVNIVIIMIKQYASWFVNIIFTLGSVSCRLQVGAANCCCGLPLIDNNLSGRQGAIIQPDLESWRHLSHHIIINLWPSPRRLCFWSCWLVCLFVCPPVGLLRK